MHLITGKLLYCRPVAENRLVEGVKINKFPLCVIYKVYL